MVDERVKQAMARWPTIPEAYGWLRLNRRGFWILDGYPLKHQRTIEFIARNYECDGSGCWYFQNGPQKVYVDLDYTPWIIHLDVEGQFVTHTGQILGDTEIHGAWLDDEGSMLLQLERGIALLNDQDLITILTRMVNQHDQPLTEEDLSGFLTQKRSSESALIFLRYGRQKMSVGWVESKRVCERFSFVQKPQPPE